MELAAITGTVVTTVTVVNDPSDIDSKGRFARFVVAFDCQHSHAGTCKVAVYRRLTGAVPAISFTPREEVAVVGPMFDTPWGGVAVEAETLSLVDSGVRAIATPHNS